MAALLERVTRLVSPVTLLIGAVMFLLPFCAVSCQSPFGGGGDFIKASGLNLVAGGDVSPDCTAFNQIAAGISSSLGNSFGGSATPAPTATATGSDCGTASSSATANGQGSSSAPNLGQNGSFARLGPFSPSSSSGKLHVDIQPLAVIALVLLALGAAVAILGGRVRAVLVAALATAAAVMLVVLRIVLNSRFSDDLKQAIASQSRGSSGSFTLPGDPSSFFSLNWGLGWTLALVAAVVVAAINLGALLAAALPAPAGVAGGPGWAAPPAEAPPPAAPPQPPAAGWQPPAASPPQPWPPPPGSGGDPAA